MKSGKYSVLMPVYNVIDFDGRVQRAAAALSARYDVTVVSVASEGSFAGSGYAVRTIDVGGGSVVARHLRFLRGLLGEARRLRPDVVHAHDFFMALPGVLAARAVGARLVYDAHELMIPEPGVAQSIRERIWYQLERWSIHHADVVIAANAHRAEAMRAHFRLAATPTVVANIPPVAAQADDEGARLPSSRITPREGVLRMVYQGDMSLARGVGAFVEAVPHLPDTFELILVGGGPDLQRLRDLAASLGVSGRVRFLGRVPNEELGSILAACDIGLISYAGVGMNNLYCAPNKLYEYAQVGLPILARENPVLREAIERYRIGVVFDDVVDGVHAVVRDLDGFRANLPAFLRDNRWENEAERLLDAYGGLLDDAPKPCPEPPRPHSLPSGSPPSEATVPGFRRGG